MNRKNQMTTALIHLGNSGVYEYAHFHTNFCATPCGKYSTLSRFQYLPKWLFSSSMKINFKNQLLLVSWNFFHTIYLTYLHIAQNKIINSLEEGSLTSSSLPPLQFQELTPANPFNSYMDQHLKNPIFR